MQWETSNLALQNFLYDFILQVHIFFYSVTGDVVVLVVLVSFYLLLLQFIFILCPKMMYSKDFIY